MKKRIFVNKNARSGVRPYIKYVLWAALGLLVLVVLIPLTSRQKPPKDLSKKSSSAADRGGTVVKEIPKVLQPAAESITKGESGAQDPARDVPSKAPEVPVVKAPAEVPGGSARPGSVAPKEQEPPKVATAPGHSPAESSPISTPRESPVSPKGKTVASEPPPSSSGTTPTPGAADSAAKPKVAGVSPAPVKPGSSTPADPKKNLTQPPAAPDKPKPEAVTGRQMYAVQVGSFKDKHGAEELKKALERKGYSAVVKSTGDPKQGQNHVVQLQPVDNMSKASTQAEQVKYVPQAKPAVITIPAGN
jgi:cell division protein FtsN